MTTATTDRDTSKEPVPHFCAKEIRKIIIASLSNFPAIFYTDQIISALKMEECRKSRDSVNSALESLYDKGIRHMDGHDYNFRWKIMGAKPIAEKRTCYKTPGVVWNQKNFKSIRC